MNQRRRALTLPLRVLSLMLALCCFWSFAGAGIAVAASPAARPAKPHQTYPHFLHVPAFPAISSPFEATSGVSRTPAPSLISASVTSSLALPVPASAQPGSETLSETLWDDTGHLRSPVTQAQSDTWIQELRTTHPSSHRAAELHLWLGEVLLARNRQPHPALWHFREAEALVSPADPLHYLAAYDSAVALFYTGAYQDSADAFRSLLAVRHIGDGFNRPHAALWLRHVSACAGYHANHAALGIPEPPRLDPFCAAAALAARLQVMGRPWDRRTLLKACRVTGEGSNMQDVLDAAAKLGVHAQIVTADDQGLIALPKPLVAYVEHDHFIAVTHADNHGVTYLCSDCGPWPGGEVDLTWQQWHTMDAGVYAVVTLPGSAWDKTLAALKTLDQPSQALSAQTLSAQALLVRVASNRLGGLLTRRIEGLVHGWPLLRGHIVLDATPAGSFGCGSSAFPIYCTGDSNQPTDTANVASNGNPTAGDPVDLATGQEEYGPDPDLIVYNPVGPSITWKRMYQTLRGPGQSYPNYTYDATYQSDDFGSGWSQPYNFGVIVTGTSPNITANILFPNGGKFAFTFSAAPTSGHPQLGTPSRSGFPALLQWDYDGTANGHYEVIYKDRTHWITGSTFAPGSVLPLAQIVDRTGNSLYFNYPTVSASKASDGWPLLGSITTGSGGTGTVLLSIQRNTTAGSDGLVDSYITSVTDHPGLPYARSIYYQAVRLTNPNCPAQYSPYYSELSNVSQIVPAGTASSGVPSRWAYGYKAVPNGESSEQINYLHTITTPSPTGSGTSTAYLWYMTDNAADSGGKTNPNYLSNATVPFVSALVDGNGNRRLYSSSDGNGNATGGFTNYSQVVVQNSGGSTIYSYQASYDNNLNETGRTDGNGHVISTLTYANASSPYSPSTVLDGNGSGNTLLPNGVPGSQITCTGTQTSANGPQGNWQITNSSGTVIATNTTPNSWSVGVTNYQGPPPNTYPVVTLAITSPSTAALGQYSIYDFDGSTYPVTVTFVIRSAVSNPNLGKTTYAYDQYGNMTSMTPPSDTQRTTAVTTNTYDYSHFALGELTQVQVGTNLSSPKSPTIYTYDDTDGYTDGNGIFQPCGLLSSVATPLPGTTGSTSTATTSYTYDLTGQGQKPLGQLGLGNVLTMTRPGNGTVSSMTTTFNYTTDGSYTQAAAIGQPVTITDNLNEVTHLRYDSQSNTIGVKDALGNETDMTYDIGNAALQTLLPATGQSGSGHAGSLNAYLYSESSGYATTAWPAATLQYGALSTTTHYNESSTAIRQTVNTYGLEGELLSVTGSTEPVAYTYDALYRLKTLQDAATNTTSYFYNAAGYLAQIVYPGAQSTPPTAPLTAGHTDTVSFTSYDGKGDLLTRVDGRNQTTTYIYNDPESWLTQITYPSGTIGTVTLAYDAYGRRGNTTPGSPGLTDGTGSQVYTYDDDNDLMSKAVTWTGLTGSKTVAYAYNADGSRHTMTADGHLFTSAYDGVGRLNSLVNDNSETTAYGYQANGWLQTKTLQNGIATTFTRDAQGRVTDLSNKLGSTTLSDFHVPATSGYDGVGNRLSVTSTVNGGAPASYSGTTSYQYDYGQTTNPQLNRSQVTQEVSTRNSGYTNVFGYDGNTSTGPGNTTSFKGAAHTFNADNQQTDSGIGYDGAGNPTTYHSQAVTYDPENRMNAYGSVQTDGYDGDGLRTWKVVSGVSTYFLYDGDQIVGIYGVSGSAAVFEGTNTWGAGGLVSRRYQGVTDFYVFDERGNVSQRTSSTGAVTMTETYDAYGARTATGSQPDPWGYMGEAGYYNDGDKSLLLCTHRFYDPATGRFVTRDPISYRGGINLYGYTRNNPISRIDAKGYDAGWAEGPSGPWGEPPGPPQMLVPLLPVVGAPSSGKGPEECMQLGDLLGLSGGAATVIPGAEPAAPPLLIIAPIVFGAGLLDYYPMPGALSGIWNAGAGLVNSTQIGGPNGNPGSGATSGAINGNPGSGATNNV